MPLTNRKSHQQPSAADVKTFVMGLMRIPSANRSTVYDSKVRNKPYIIDSYKRTSGEVLSVEEAAHRDRRVKMQRRPRGLAAWEAAAKKLKGRMKPRDRMPQLTPAEFCASAKTLAASSVYAVHDLWVQYATAAVSRDISGVVRMELVGGPAEVVQSTHHESVGAKGIIIHESLNTVTLVTYPSGPSKPLFTTVQKAGTLLKLQVPGHGPLVLSLSAMALQPDARDTKKWKGRIVWR